MSPRDIDVVNVCKPEYAGFVFVPESRRFVTPNTAEVMKKRLLPDIHAVGVFVNVEPDFIADLLARGIIDLVQLHGSEDNNYIKKLRALTHKPIIKAFSVVSENDVYVAEDSPADYVLLDAGSGGTGTRFDWGLLRKMQRPYFLAGGLNPENVGEAVRELQPWGVDVSSGIETGGSKSPEKMHKFIINARTAYVR